MSRVGLLVIALGEVLRKAAMVGLGRWASQSAAPLCSSASTCACTALGCAAGDGDAQLHAPHTVSEAAGAPAGGAWSVQVISLCKARVPVPLGCRAVAPPPYGSPLPAGCPLPCITCCDTTCCNVLHVVPQVDAAPRVRRLVLVGGGHAAAAGKPRLHPGLCSSSESRWRQPNAS